MMWLLTSAISGAVVMALEVAAFRLYAPFFGYSVYVWGSLISVVMLALAFGYSLGGRFADRCTGSSYLYTAILASAFYQLLMVFIVQPLLSALSGWGDFAGPVAATLVIFAPTMTVLAGVSPFVIRLLTRVGRLGSTAGAVYSASTAGSTIGVLGASFFLLPGLGTRVTLEIICAVTALVAVAGLAASSDVARRPTALAALVPFAALLAAPKFLWSANTIWTAESAYNLVRVARQGKRLVLLLNSANSVHTIRDQSSRWTGFYYDQFALGPLLTPVRRIMVLGMGGGGSIRAARVTAPNADIDAVEIDAKVIDAAEHFFGIRPDSHLRIHTADARPWLKRQRGDYDLVQMDLYHGGPYVPFYLSTVEFFKVIRSRLTGDGLLMMNVFDPSRAQNVLAAIEATLKQVYPTVMVLPAGFGGNKIVLAFTRPQSLASIRDRLAAVDIGNPAKALAARSATEVIEPPVRAGAIVFTDDCAPIEEMTRRMMSE